GAACRAVVASCSLHTTSARDWSSGVCSAYLSSSVECRSAAGECDLAENCPGNGPNCPADTKKTAGTACTADSNPCTLDECDGTRSEERRVGREGSARWRAAAGACEVAETWMG